MKSLYIHIPFCLKKCLYCDFNSYTKIELEDEYIKALLKEIDKIKESNFETIFIGGGTPTALSNKNLDILLSYLKKFSPKEYSIESNPGTLNEINLSLMKNNGINRLSIGLQSTKDSILSSLGRIHTYNEFLEGYNKAREVGFNNINIDIMFGVPNQSFSDFKETLEKVIKLSPEHISAYSLIVEEGTPFYAMREKGLLKIVDEDIERDMYDYLIDYLESSGYNWYEISNFAKKNYECKHNLVYWKCNEYYGVGAGAHSYISGKRYSNENSIESYIKSINNRNSHIENIESVDRNSSIEEYMFLGLRIRNGISKNDFYKRFNVDIFNVYGKQINKLKEKNLIVETNDNIKLSKEAVSISNSILVEFIN